MDIFYEKKGHIAYIVFNRPQKANAISRDMWLRIPEYAVEASSDDEVRVLALRGEGGFFSAGADLSEFSTQRQDSSSAEVYNNILKKAYDSVGNFKKPAVALIRGACLGGACGLAVQCDLRLSSKNGFFAVPAVKRGIAYNYAGIKKMADIVGVAAAREIFITGRRYSAEEAFRIGLVNRIYGEDVFAGETEKYLEEIAGNAPLAVRAAKVALNEYSVHCTERDLDKVREAERLCFASKDYTEGYNAFLEKRSAAFKER